MWVRKCHGTVREYFLGSTKPPGLTDTKYTKAIFQGNFKLFLPEYSAISKNKYQQTRASFPWKQCKIAVCVILVLKVWRLKKPSSTFEFSGSNTAFYSRSLTTTQETKKFMARIEVPWRLQIDKPDQWRGHHRRPFQRKKVSVLADGGWSERHSTYIPWLSVNIAKGTTDPRVEFILPK